MLGRFTDEDARERTVRAMQERYHVDLEQAERVEATALEFLAQVRHAWRLEDPLADLALQWAARLHETGLDVSHSGYHRHGAYLLENAGCGGAFSREGAAPALPVSWKSHRRKLALAGLEDLVPPWDHTAVRLIVLLRLAVLLHRGRVQPHWPNIELRQTPSSLVLRFPRRWLKGSPAHQHRSASGDRLPEGARISLAGLQRARLTKEGPAREGVRGFVTHIKELLLRGALSFDFDIARVVERVHDHATIGGASGSRLVGFDGLRQPITLGHQLL